MNETMRASGRGSVVGGLVLIGVGSLALLSALNIEVPEQLWSLGLVLPLALALRAGMRAFRRTGRVPSGVVWWALGTSFPAALGLSGLTGLDFTALLGSWVWPAALLALGVSILLRR